MTALIGGVVALLFMIGASTVTSVFSVQALVVHTSIAIATPLSLRRPFHEVALVMLAVNFLADQLASGPPGVYGLLLSVVFFAIFVVSQRIGGRYLLATAAIAAIASGVVDLGYGLMLSVFYPEAGLLRLFAVTFVPNAVATALVALLFAWVVSVSERLSFRRSESRVTID